MVGDSARSGSPERSRTPALNLAGTMPGQHISCDGHRQKRRPLPKLVALPPPLPRKSM